MRRCYVTYTARLTLRRGTTKNSLNWLISLVFILDGTYFHLLYVASLRTLISILFINRRISYHVTIYSRTVPHLIIFEICED